jgi:exodeoxyribonuclease VII small subunit
MDKELSFEQKIQKSKQILSKLMQADITLSDSVKLYEDGIKELNEASKMLEDAQIKYQEIKK